MPSPACPSREELSVYIVGKLAQRALRRDRHAPAALRRLPGVPGNDQRQERYAAVRTAPANGSRASTSTSRSARRRWPASRQIGCDPSLTAREQLAADAGSDFPQQIGPYRLLAKLGQGGMGTVYKALHTKLDRVVALKLLPEDRMRAADAVARFEREMKAVGKLDHPNIVRASDADEEHGRHYLVMEYVDGIDLSELSRRSGRCGLPMPASSCARRPSAWSMRTSTVWCTATSSRESDAGCCPRREDGTRARHSSRFSTSAWPCCPTRSIKRELTTSGQTMGTLDYMAPEQCGDSHAVDIRADIYSLGATLYKLLTGEPIFSGANYQKPLQKFRALATETAPPIQSRRADIPARPGRCRGEDGRPRAQGPLRHARRGRRRTGAVLRKCRSWPVSVTEQAAEASPASRPDRGHAAESVEAGGRYRSILASAGG